MLWVGVYPSMLWAGGVSQHALGRGGVCPSMHWVGQEASEQND